MFNSDPQVIGQTIRVSGQPFTIVGVTAKEFIGTELIRPVCWLPLMMRDALSNASQCRRRAGRRTAVAASFGLWGDETGRNHGAGAGGTERPDRTTGA